MSVTLLNIGTSSYMLKKKNNAILEAECNRRQYQLVNAYSKSVNYFVIYEPFGGGFKMKLYYCFLYRLPLVMDANSARALQGFEEGIHFTTLEKVGSVTSRERTELLLNLIDYGKTYLTPDFFGQQLDNNLEFIFSAGQNEDSPAF